MERAALLRRLTWQTATVISTTFETPRVKTITLAAPDWPGHRAGQQVDVRLTAPDGYQTQRSYSITSAPEDENPSLTVERLDDGEVSPYLVDELREGDELEFRGPIDGYFVWDNELGGSLFLVAGGSGVVPRRSILRHHRAIGSPVPGAAHLYLRTNRICRDGSGRLGGLGDDPGRIRTERFGGTLV